MGTENLGRLKASQHEFV